MPGSGWSIRLARVAPVVIALALGAWAIVGSRLLFPYLSNNNDEAVYLLQADTLRHGRLFPPAPSNWKSFLPWFAFHRQGRFVLKYTPVHAAFIAASGAVLGSDRAALAVLAAAAVASSYWLAYQVLKDRRQASVAAAFFALSPLVILQSITFLSYLSSLALLQGFGAALIMGVRRRSNGWLTVAGLLFGIGVFARAYDALLFAVPFGLWLLWVHRRRMKELLRIAGWLALGSASPLAMMLAFFQAATGSPFNTPFNIDPSDTLGFGHKRMSPGGRTTLYTVGRAWKGFAGNIDYLGRWTFGGLLLVALAVVGMKRLKANEPAGWLALVAVTVPAGYFFFWGSYGTVIWGGPQRFGPFYYLPLLVPLCILGARGFCALWDSRRLTAALLLLLMAPLSVPSLTGAFKVNNRLSEGRAQLYRPVLEASLRNAVVFLPLGSRLLQPWALAQNPSLDERVLWAVDRGPRANLSVMEEFPGRAAYRVVTRGRAPRAGPSKRFRSWLEPQAFLRGRKVLADVVVQAGAAAGPLRLDVAMGSLRESLMLQTQPKNVGPWRVPVLLSPASARMMAGSSRVISRPRPPGKGALEVSLWSTTPAGRSEELLAQKRVELRTSGSRIELMLPASYRGGDSSGLGLGVVPASR